MESKNEILALHFKYCGLIAVMLLVAIATERWSSSKDFTTYLSNAATMTSLLLGVVAIFYSFISNDGMSRSLGSINTVSNEIQGIRTEIQRFADQTKDGVKSAEANNELVRDASVQFSGTMTSLSKTIHQLSEQNEVLRNLVASLPTRMDQLETRFSDVAMAINEKPKTGLDSSASASALSKEAVESFLRRATHSQNLLSIACALAAKTDRPLDIPAFCKVIELNYPVTLTGFLSCMHAIQLCQRRVVEGSDKVFTVVSVHPELAHRALEYFVEYVDRNFSNKPEDRAKWIGKVAAVEAMFASSDA